MKIPIPDDIDDATRRGFERVDAMLVEVEAHYKQPVHEYWLRLTQKNPAWAARFLTQWYRMMKLDKKYFGPKYYREEQRIFILWTSEAYKNDLVKARKKVEIPDSYDINSEVDIQVDGGSHQKVYFRLKTPELDRRLDREAKRLMKKHNLTKRHHDWTRDTILNDREPHGFTYYETDYLDKLSLEVNWPKIPDANLTIGEKHYVKDRVKAKLGVKNRPLESVRNKYDAFLKYLGRSKNSLRRLQDPIDSARMVSGISNVELAKQNRKSSIASPTEIDRIEKKKSRLYKRHPKLKKVKN